MKCLFFIPEDQAQLIPAYQTVKRSMETVELTDEELTVIQDDYTKLEAAVERAEHLSAPTTLYKPAKGSKSRGIPLMVLNNQKEPLSERE